ncbi:EF-P lysine aminoacylase EpmA [Desulfurivibrio sp. D14AmB]|uniref:EF-P lysine aminoacylase EpmA n=1 Tax=Desulfurivibrio sp. D14AmB TaxID=3374370 RepID=UPI00376EBD6D
MLHLWGRAGMIRAVRRFFDQRGYLEVETPIRIPAPAPEPHLIPQAAGSWFLQTSPELCMKRLLARGVPQLYQICKCFRREERGSRHLPEFTMLEWYRAGADYYDLMRECEELLAAVAGELAAGHYGSVAARTLAGLDLAPPWERLGVAEAFHRHAGMAVEEALARDLFEELLVEKIEPHLGRSRPTFLYDYPAELGALARLSPDNPAVSQRFELYIGGLELANGFSELIDPVEQRQRFVADRRKIRAAGRRPPPMPEKFLTELALMPPAAGIALGLDRLAMIMLGAHRIDAVLAFTPEQL